MVTRSAEWLAQYQARTGIKTVLGAAPKKPEGIIAEGKPAGPRGMNKTEERYASEVLWPAYQAGEILLYEFEIIRIRVGWRTTKNGPVAKYYKPDFLVMRADCKLEIHEIKGEYVTRDGKAFFGAAVEVLPIFRYKMVSYVDGEWQTIQEHF